MKFTSEETAILKRSLQRRKQRLENIAKRFQDINRGETITRRNISNRLSSYNQWLTARLAANQGTSNAERSLFIKIWINALAFSGKYAISLAGNRLVEITPEDPYATGVGLRIQQVRLSPELELHREQFGQLLAEQFGEICANRDTHTYDIVTGNNIIDAYREQYFGSCMHNPNGYPGARALDAYANSPHVAMMTVRDQNSTLVARALLWKVEINGAPEFMLDRIYPTNNSRPVQELLSKRKSIGIRYLKSQVEGGLIHCRSIVRTTSGRLPYIDTMHYRGEYNPNSGDLIVSTNTNLTSIRSTNAIIDQQANVNPQRTEELLTLLSSGETFSSIRERWQQMNAQEHLQNETDMREVQMIIKAAKKRTSKEKPKINVRAILHRRPDSHR